MSRYDLHLRRYDFADEADSMRDVPMLSGSVWGNGETEPTLCLTLFLSNSQILTIQVVLLKKGSGTNSKIAQRVLRTIGS